MAHLFGRKKRAQKNARLHVTSLGPLALYTKRALMTEVTFNVIGSSYCSIGAEGIPVAAITSKCTVGRNQETKVQKPHISKPSRCLSLRIPECLVIEVFSYHRRKPQLCFARGIGGSLLPDRLVGFFLNLQNLVAEGQSGGEYR